MAPNGRITVPAAQPTGKIEIAIFQNGQIGLSVQGVVPLVALGMLRFAETSIIAQAQAGPGIEVAPPGFPTG